MGGPQLRLHIFLFFAGGWAQIRILSPKSLQAAFKETHGVVYGTTSTFGAPFYGERVLGRLMYAPSAGKRHCTADDYSLDSGGRSPPHEDDDSEVPEAVGRHQPVDVVLVHRGGCTFVTKVLVAQEKRAHAVVIVDYDTSRSSQDVQKIIMADDGHGEDVRIPSLMVSAADGEHLIQSAKDGEVVVELVWDIPRGEVVVMDYWGSSGSSESLEFLKRFQVCAEGLRFNLYFVPHYQVVNLPLGGDASSYSSLCRDAAAARHCAPDPDGGGPILGVDVVQEDLRQLCLWNVTAQKQDGGPVGLPQVVMYSPEFWNYVSKLQDSCPLEGSTPSTTFGEVCSKRLMRDIGVSLESLEDCIASAGEELLDAQVRNTAWSAQALQLNGWRYSGPFDPQTVLQAVCSGYTLQPTACSFLLTLHGRRRPFGYHNSLLSKFVWPLLCLTCCFVSVFYILDRKSTASMRNNMREEVMLEVRQQMSDYVLMQKERQGVEEHLLGGGTS